MRFKTRLAELKKPISKKKFKNILTINKNNKKKLFLDNKKLFQILKRKIIHFDDGKLSFRVSKVSSQDVEIIAINSGVLKSRKGIHIPGLIIIKKIFQIKIKNLLILLKKIILIL